MKRGNKYKKLIWLAWGKIRSEMIDGDNEPIELKGIYRENIFEIWSVSANGHTASE